MNTTAHHDRSADTPQSPATSPADGRHPINVAHLILGVVLLGLALIWALVASTTVAWSDIKWLLPIPWIAAGAAGLAVTAIRPRKNTHPEES